VIVKSNNLRKGCICDRSSKWHWLSYCDCFCIRRR